MIKELLDYLRGWRSAEVYEAPIFSSLDDDDSREVIEYRSGTVRYNVHHMALGYFYWVGNGWIHETDIRSAERTPDDTT